MRSSATTRSKTATRRMFEVLGRLAALAAVVVGVVFSAQLFAGRYEGGVKVLIVSAGGAVLVGGLLYLVGLDLWKGPRASIVRVAGWLLFTVGFLVPTSLQALVLLASVLAIPAVLVWGTTARPSSPIASSESSGP